MPPPNRIVIAGTSPCFCPSAGFGACPVFCAVTGLSPPPPCRAVALRRRLAANPADGGGLRALIFGFVVFARPARPLPPLRDASDALADPGARARECFVLVRPPH